MIHVIVADDQALIRGALSALIDLEDDMRVVAQAADGREAIAAVEAYTAENSRGDQASKAASTLVVIMDVEMPVMDGYALVKALRETKHTLPILMITAKSQLESLEEAFKLGVDDYMVKPIRLTELVLRVQALLRRAQLETEKVLLFEHTRLDYNALTLTDLERDEVYQIPRKEFYLLYKLLSNPEKIFTRLDLLDDIWGMEEDLDERLVDACIKRIRQKFKENKDFEIVTIRGLGYKGTIKNG